MKRILIVLAVLMLLATTVSAASLLGGEYTDVPTAMTQDSVLRAEAGEDCQVEILQPDEASVALLDDVYTFVYEEENRPARYYDEPTQKMIQELCGGNIDVLHMSEAMRLQLTGETEETVRVEMELDEEYRTGQLVIVVHGIPQGELEYIWYPYRAEVPETGLIRWDIPAEDWEALAEQPTAFHVLTIRHGPGGEILWHEEEHSDSFKIFSKNSGDVNYTYRWYTENGAQAEDDFRIFLTDLTDPMEEEVLRLAEHVEDELPILDYFPEERKAEALLMLPEGIRGEELMAYDIIALMDENYKDTYGDVNVEISFATSYDTEKPMVILAGFPVEDAEEQPYFEWYVLRAEALEPEEDRTETDLVRIGLKQLNLPRMEEEPLMLVVISQMLDDLQ